MGNRVWSCFYRTFWIVFEDACSILLPEDQPFFQSTCCGAKITNECFISKAQARRGTWDVKQVYRFSEPRLISS